MASGAFARVGARAGDYSPPKRAIARCFIHCSASSNKSVTARDVHTWHLERGWAGIGYHFFITTAGDIQVGRSLETTPAAQEGYNAGTIAICVNGLRPSDFTKQQFDSLVKLCNQIWTKHAHHVTFHGHCEVAAKACPVFDYKAVLRLDNKGRISPTPEEIRPQLPALPHWPVLRRGASGPDVKRLQECLSLRSPVSPGFADGKFGEDTEKSVRAFQANNHLYDDGVVGPVTWEVLEAGEVAVYKTGAVGATEPSSWAAKARPAFP